MYPPEQIPKSVIPTKDPLEIEEQQELKKSKETDKKIALFLLGGFVLMFLLFAGSIFFLASSLSS